MTIKEKYNYWLNNEGLDQQSKDMLVSMSDAEIEDSFFKDIEFGTGGIRGVLGIGTNRLNVYNIRRFNYGFGEYLKEKYPEQTDRGIVIAYDNRHMSKEFADESAKVLNALGICVYLFKELAPTPQLSFAIRELNALGGIVITASHNPPEYNGYKLYNSHGCQLVPNEAKMVIAKIDALPPALEIKLPSTVEQNIVYLDDDIDTSYVNMITSLGMQKCVDKANLRVVFSPQHGASNKLLTRLLQESGYDVVIVEEQCAPDPDFSHTKSPNPEDKVAYDLPIQYAIEADADIIVTTDPDADRVGVACKGKDGQFQLISGNQMGALLLDYIIKNKEDMTQVYVVTTTVTSDLGRQVCEKNNVPLYLVHTGFKFIGDLIQTYKEQKPDKEFLFGYEESYGYLISDSVRDKDALQSAYLICEMAAVYKDQGLSMIDKLNEVYDEYGFYIDQLYTFQKQGIQGMESIKRTMRKLRKDGIKSIGGIRISDVQDFSMGVLGLPKADVVKFLLDDQSFVAFRPSGTEPKFKVYCSIKGENNAQASEKLVQIYQDVRRIVGD